MFVRARCNRNSRYGSRLAAIRIRSALAGETGANLLTHLLGQSVEDLKEKITLYRKAIQEKGGVGHVTLMLHTFVGNSQEDVAKTVREPLCNYLKSSVDLMKQVARGLGEELGSDAAQRPRSHGFNRSRI